MECLGMSSESLMLAIQLLLEDVELCEKSKKGKEREDEMLDCDVALQSCRDELEEMATTATQASDQALCLSIAEAVELDAALIAELMAQEEQAARDRQFALRLSINSSATPSPASSQTNSAEPPINDLDDSLIERFRLMNRFVPDYAESSSSASSREQPETGECIACTDRFSSSALFSLTMLP
ncbi:Hypothetical protein NCS54_00204000 [Fusarium falciforme]|uniref:Hypothetical protein n=1 Tax=Fusarium falciforme TaxID=195108 RepID=UPI002300F7CA|nr:Hypothetical protein NCS54_00204000 [Fusarium falciforme]WAO84812.1 Hypothetical protein NCS54_00204000 [Fusarium falciforme]